MTSPGQVWALRQLEAIVSKSGGALEIVEVTGPPSSGGQLVIAISVDCSGYAWTEGGIKFRARERLVVSIDRTFPLEVPKLRFDHSDYGGFAHVQWGTTICLYQSPETEWQPDDGAYGFFQRMDDWLRAAAANQLDPVGLPLHPPVAYSKGKALAVIPTQDTPSPGNPYWAGYGIVDRENTVCMELGEWLPFADVAGGTRVVPTILLPGDMPFEYPETIAELKTVLGARRIPLDVIRLLLTVGAMRTPDEKPLVLVLGAAMRGVSGGQLRQHLAAWQIEPEHSLELKKAALEATEVAPIDEELFKQWTERATINWCRVLEARPEIVIPRDTGTPAQFWRGRHVAILGCGAIGSTIAALLARAGVAKLQLYDRDIVKPGTLVRQDFDWRHVGFSKSSATQTRVNAINPKTVTEWHSINILNVLDDTKKLQALFEADVVINATASVRIASALEHRLRDGPVDHPPILSMAVGHTADAGVMTLSQGGVVGIAHDLDRRLKLEFAYSPSGEHFLDEFWPIAARTSRLFQPEPGCSDPTFVGSAADMAGLMGRMLNVASGWLASGIRDRAFGFAIHQPPNARSVASVPNEAEYSWQSDAIHIDPRLGYQIRLTPAAEKAMLSWMRKSERQRGHRVETGGILFGQIDEFLKVVWVTSASGPPPDSVATAHGFLCGTQGVAQLNQTMTSQSRNSVSFIGMWHSHPGSAPDPSPIDKSAMVELFARPDFRGRQFLMLIVGGTPNEPHFAGSVYGRDE